MCTEESGNPVRRQDGVNGWPVLWVRLKHLLDQIPQLIGQMTGKGGVRTPTHLQNQALPARCLELDTVMRRDDCQDKKPQCNDSITTKHNAADNVTRSKIKGLHHSKNNPSWYLTVQEDDSIW